ncbi:MAG: Crp/Fnr family transcriptional regulator [Nitratireductor sp.]|jgi:CRP/FNR family transcriptional regulator|nr:Crp/Fnr family transcriptional regulator [Nitratireductor sp.]
MLKDLKRKDVHNSDVPVVCRSCEARHRGICGALDPEQLVHLSKHTSRHVFSSEQELVAAGEDIHRYSNILSGVVKLSKMMSDGRQQIVGLQFAPDFLGRPFRRQSDVVAEAATDVRVCSFPRGVIEELTRQAPELEHRLHEQTLKELDEAREWMLTLGRKNANEKVASFLLLIATHFDPEEQRPHAEIKFDLPLKRSDIADFLGLTIETVSRQLTKLRKAGLIQIENTRTVIIRDLDALRDASEAAME